MQIVLNKFDKWQKCFLVLSLIVNINLRGFFKDLMGTFYLSVCLKVKTNGGLLVCLESMIYSYLKQREKSKVAI